MHRFFVPQLYNETMTIEGVDARHISKVLRMQPGSQLQLVSDDGVSALAEITAIDSECVTVHCLEKLAESHEPAVRLILAQGLAKGREDGVHHPEGCGDGRLQRGACGYGAFRSAP